MWAWGALQRVDAFAVALEWVGIALFVDRPGAGAGGGRAGRGRRLGRSGSPGGACGPTLPLFLGAVYARQTVVAGAVAVYGTLLLLRPRPGLTLAVAFGGAGLAVFALLER